LGYLEVVENERVPLRQAEGLSLNYFQDLPLQKGVFIDGEGPIILNETSAPLDHVDSTTFGVALRLLGTPENAFVAGARGMPELVRLAQLGTSAIYLSEADSHLLELIASQPGWGGDILRSRRVRTRHADPRSTIAGLDRSFDLIHLPFASGQQALEPTSLVTVESIEEMLVHLDGRGLIAITTPIESPPRAVPRLLVTTAIALENLELDPAKHVAAIRAWDAATILVSRSKLSTERIASIRSFAGEQSFDLIWVPGMQADEANRFNVLDRAWHHEAARAAVTSAETRNRFIERYKFDVSPPTDDRPWFGSAMKWETLLELLELRDEGGTALIRNGYPVLIVALLQAVLSGAILIVLPLALTRSRGSGDRKLSHWRVVVTFGSLGLAFLMIEIIYIYRLTMVLGRPLESTTIVLASFLLFSGLGSITSAKLRSALGFSTLKMFAVTCTAAATLSLVEIPLLATAEGWLLHLDHSLRVVSCIGLIAPLAFLMGSPFPTALETIRRAGNEWWIAWAWAINGCASVVSAILAALLTIHLGMAVVTSIGAGLYLLAGIAFSTSPRLDDFAINAAPETYRPQQT
ncbi:MAG: hypothetical protein R3338_11585, partial [Thermoanaerobaculia bacterium]|nr:hypothetical protein [Thermoanaerobaculia bacterium]